MRGVDGRPVYDLSLLDARSDVAWEWMLGGSELEPSDLLSYDAILLLRQEVTADSLRGVKDLRHIARVGVGVDNVDISACTSAGVLVTTTPDSVRRPMASGAMAFILALAHRLPEMDHEVRANGWDRFAHIGMGLNGRVLGIIGLGNVGRELAMLAAPFGLTIAAADPFLSEPPAGIQLWSLDSLLAEADFIAVTCPLTPETHHLLDRDRLALMKPTAYVINIARGAIVDGTALADALGARRLAGAALDVFELEPVPTDDPLLGLDNVILAPHAVGLTDEFFRLGGLSACRAVLAVADSRVPEFPLNPNVLRRASHS